MNNSMIAAVKNELDHVLPEAKVRAINSASKASSFMDMLGVFKTNPPSRGVEEMLKSYSVMPWLRAVVDKVGSSVATTTWRVFVKTKTSTDESGKSARRPVKAKQVQNMRLDERKKELARLKAAGELVEIEEYPLIDALYAVGPSFTGYTNRELTQKWLDLAGEAFWIKERDAAGTPINFIPLPPHWVTDTPSGDSQVFKIQTPAGKLDEVTADDMIWFYHPNPHDPYGRGSGMGVTLGDELETDEYAAKFMKTFFYNSARPDFLISSSELKKEDTERLEKRWVDKLRGWRRSFLPFFMNRSVEVHTLGTDYAHLSMLDLRKNQRDAVIQVYGVPPEVLGIVEASNRATSEVAEYLYARWVLTPRLEFMRQTLQHRLVPDYDERIILDYDSPVAQDKEHILKVATISPWALYIDEWREMMGKLSLPDGKGQIFMKPLNYEAVTLEDLGEPYSQQDGNGDDETDDGPPVDDPPEEDPEEDPEDEDETKGWQKHTWPELMVNQISRQRVSPRIGTRKDQVEAALASAFTEIADEARKQVDGIEEALTNDVEAAVLMILDEATAGRALDNAVAKLTSVYVLAADQARANLALFAENTKGIEDLEPLFKLKESTKSVEASILFSLRLSLLMAATLTMDKTRHDATLYMIDSIGTAWGDSSKFVEAEGEGDVVVALFSKNVEQMADHAIVHMCNLAQEALWAEAVRNGIIDSEAVSRLWISRLGCRSCNECSGMDGATATIDGSWDLSKGGTVDTPTDSHPECHCTERLVRKEVDK